MTLAADGKTIVYLYLLRHCILPMILFAKTGSGQTKGKHSNKRRVYAGVTILQQPLPELATLRVAASHFAKQGQSLGTGKILPISGVTGAQMELRLNITVSGNTTLRCRNRLFAPFSN